MMSDNGDFMARYLPEGPERGASVGQPLRAGEPAVIPSLVPAEEPRVDPAPPPGEAAPPAGAPQFTPPPQQSPPVSPPPHGERAAAPPAPGPHAQVGAGGRRSWLPDGESSPPTAETAPATTGHQGVSAAQRWAPQADAHAAAYTHKQIQVGEVVKARRRPPEMGWRKGVYVATNHLVNLGPGPAERTLRDHKARITTNIPGNYQISAICIKGGVGKTTAVAAVGTAFRQIRNEPTIAIDANPTYGSLGRLIAPAKKASIREFLGHADVTNYSIARQYFGLSEVGLEVLAGNQNVANPLTLTPETFTETLARIRGFYQLSLVDCGAEIDHQVIPAVLSESNALMIVGSMNVEGGLAVETTLDWLAARNGHELLKRSVIVLNDAYRCATAKFVTHLTQTLGPRVRAVKVIPFDAHLRDAQPLDFGALAPRTRSALIDVAAELADGFPTAGTLTG